MANSLQGSIDSVRRMYQTAKQMQHAVHVRHVERDRKVSVRVLLRTLARSQLGLRSPRSAIFTD